LIWKKIKFENFNISENNIISVKLAKVLGSVATVEALRKKERQDETQFIIKFVGKTSLGPSYSAL
jgi:hypothetical protein